MFGLPIGPFTTIILALVIYLGLTQRVLDRMKLNDTQAMVLVLLLFAGTFLPEVRVYQGIRIDIGGAIIPLVVAGYLLFTAGTAKERLRAIAASIVTAGVIFAFNTFLPHEGTQFYRFDVDPVWFPGIAAGIIGYIAGRSRRGAFIAGLTGVVINDLIAAFRNIIVGVPGRLISIGGAGALDATIIAAVIAVLLAEVIGETREFLQGGPSRNRPPELLKGLANGDGDGRTTAKPRAHAGTAVTVTFLALGLVWTFYNYGWPTAWGIDETLNGKYYVMVDSHGETIMTTSRIVNRGDEFIDAHNRHWRVYSTKGYTAWATNLGVVNLQDYIKALEQPRPQETLPVAVPPANPKGRIGIYHTHNDESYVPTDGTYTIDGVGTIHKVGDAFEQALWSRNITTVRSQDLHLPHDRGAYVRSRRTATSIVQAVPDAIFDIHRDATPPEEYAATVNGQDVTKINIVVGQQNPNYANTLKVAAALKSTGDAMYPGLMKGVYITRGSFNQDLYPDNLLVEIGAHTNSRLAAENSMRYFAAVVDNFLYGGR